MNDEDRGRTVERALIGWTENARSSVERLALSFQKGGEAPESRDWIKYLGNSICAPKFADPTPE
ncbi:unnamed protein product [Prunus armeniaca]|uniref:Uncharacterized protein n=1 Tax=Prunus armeniaca TaxID=36596 RepID=A0A6J5W8U1_PRUAR|nr:unnamed protein product [Prunus armeniaca]